MLQQMVYFPGLNLLFPANVLYYFGIFKGIVAFDLYQFKQLNKALFEFTPTDPLTQQLWVIGVRTSSFILENKTFFYIFLFQVFLMLLYALISLLLYKRERTWSGGHWISRLHARLKKDNIWKAPIQLIKIGQFSYLLAALVNVLNPALITRSDFLSYRIA